MKLNNQKGFTLIELIMVIVILGILAATVVPRFFDFTTDAKNSREEAVYGALKSGINLYAAEQLAINKTKAYPSVATANLQNVILDDVPDGLSYVTGIEADPESPGSVTSNGYFIYDPDGVVDDIVYFVYAVQTTGSRTTFTLTKATTAAARDALL